MATPSFRQYNQPPRSDMEYLNNPLSPIQQPENPNFSPVQREDLNKPHSLPVRSNQSNSLSQLLPTQMNTRNLTSITSPGQPTNTPFNLSSFSQLGSGGSNASPSIFQRGGGAAWLKDKGIMQKSSLSGKQAGLIGVGGMAGNALGKVVAKKKAKTGGAISGAASGASTGAMIGSMFGGVGAAPGAVVGGLIGGIKGWFSGKKKLKEERIAKGLDPKTGKPLAGGPPGLSTIGGQGGPSGTLGRVVGSDPYGQLRAETEARYRPLDTPYTPFMPMPMLGGTQPFKVSTNPWDGGGDALGGQSTYGG